MAPMSPPPRLMAEVTFASIPGRCRIAKRTVRLWLADGVVGIGSSRSAPRSLVERDELPSPGTEIELSRSRDLLLGIDRHLEPLGQPTGRAGDGEQNREHVDGKPESLVDEA